jgi:hypothetical protein
MEQNRKPRIKLHSYNHLVFNKGAKNIHWGKDNLFNRWCWESWLSTCRKHKLDHLPLTLYKNQLQMIRDINVRPNTLKLLQEKIQKTLDHIGIGNYFLNRTPIAKRKRVKD